MFRITATLLGGLVAASAGAAPGATIRDDGTTIAGQLAFPLPGFAIVAPAGTGEDCVGVPGSVVHDDGTYESGFGGYWESVTSARFVDRFTPSAWPASYAAVCVAITKMDPASMLDGFDFDIVAYDDDGPDGAPGTLLGRQSVHVEDLPEYVFGAPGEFLRVDISALGLSIGEGDVYLGAEWDPSQSPGVFKTINVDSSGGPPAFGQMSLNGAEWSTLFTGFPPHLGFPDYTALQIRAIEAHEPAVLAADAGSIAIDDHCAFVPGHGNGVAEPGETIDLDVPVFAAGGDFSNVTVSLGLPAPSGVTYTAASAPLGAIADGERASAQLGISLATDATCLAELQLPLVIDSDQGKFQASIALPVGQVIAGVGPRGLPIKTNYDASGIDSTIHVAQSATIANLAVRVHLRHYSVQAVELALTSPAGTTIRLLDRPGYPPSPGCENAMTEVLFTDGAPDPETICAAPPGGTPWPVTEASPVDPLATLAGENLQGDWTLTVYDHWEGSIGALMDWELIPTPALHDVCAVCADPIFRGDFE